jgi:hypothetical protein
MNKDEALRLALEALSEAHYVVEHRQDVKKREQAITAIKEALANEALDKMAENARELGLDYEPAQPFITHNVEQPYDWSEWVCPDPKGYLMKCCDCGLVHEAEFAVVRYKSETEREDCDIVDDPNLQAVFRMRRSEEWTPEDTAHRSGGLPMAQPEQPKVRTGDCLLVGVCASEGHKIAPQRKPLSDDEIEHAFNTNSVMVDNGNAYMVAGLRAVNIARAIEAAHGIKGEA